MRRIRPVLRLLWGFVVLVAVITLIAAIGYGLEGMYTSMALALGLLVALGLLAVGIERLTEPTLCKPRSGGREPGEMSRAMKRAVRVGLAALITAPVVITAKQVKVIAEEGVSGWMNAEATTVGELAVVSAVLVGLLALLVWPAWLAGAHLAGKAYDHRLKRMLLETRRRRAAEARQRGAP